MAWKLISPILLFMFSNMKTANSANECATVFNNVRLTAQNVLFVGDDNKTFLDQNLYSRALESFKDQDKGSIISYLRQATELRIVELEELVAAMDAFVPSENSLFGILRSFSRLRFNEVALSEDFLKPSLLIEFESRLALGKKVHLPSHSELLLTFAKRLHELSLASLGSSRMLLARPHFYVEEVLRLDAFLEMMVRKVGSNEDIRERVFRRPWRALPILREILFGLGFIWSHPVTIYRPNSSRLPNSIETPEAYARRILIELGPLTSYHWFRTHMMWAAFAGLIVMVPNQITDMRSQVARFNKIWTVIESGEGKKIFDENYKRNLQAIYRKQISEWEAELQLEQAKLQSGPKNSEAAEKIKLLQEQIDYYREKLKD